MIEIRRLDGTTVLALHDMPEGALVHRELGGDHYVKLPFTTGEPVCLKIGDHVILPDFGRFELTEPYAPAYNRATGGYDYTLRLDAYYMKWKNKVCRYIPTASASETSFHLTATVGVHLGVVVRGINALGAKDSNYRYEGREFVFQLKNFPAEKEEAAKYKQYDNTDFISALDDLASIFECEWWVEDAVICFGKCRIDGTEVEMEIDVNVEDMSGSESRNDHATRIIAFGSDRNLPKDYRKDSGADITKNGVVQKRLMLPLTGEHACPYGYIQDGGVESETEAIEIVAVNDDIYPRTKCVVGKVETYTSTAKDEETKEAVTKTYYRLTDGSGFVFSNDYRLDGEELRILFQSGKMNGMDFECSYSDEEKYYEVIANEDYGRELPDTALHPEEGDEFVVYGWDSTKIGDTRLIEAAEEELYRAAVEKLQDLKTDPNTYTCRMMSDWYEEKMRTESLGVWSLGQPVKLINPASFADGRSSRIIGYEIKLDIPYDTPEYIVGEAAAYSRTRDMEQKIDSLTFNGAAYQNQGGGGGGVYLVTTTSTTPSSDYNAYSAARSDRNFLRKDRADTARGDLSFEGRCSFGGGAAFRSDVSVDGGALLDVGGPSRFGGAARFAARLLLGDAGVLGSGGEDWLERLAVRALLRFARAEMSELEGAGGFSSGLGGRGLRLWNDAARGWCGELDSLTVRRGMVIYELLIRKVRAVGGSLLVSAASGRVRSASLEGGVWRLEMEEANEFVAGDLALCQSWRGTGETLRHYHVRVAGADASGVWVEESEFGGAVPAAGDELVLRGSVSDASRQSMVLIEAADAHPRISVVDGMRTKTGGEVRTAVGDLDGVGSEWCVPSGHGLYSDNVFLRGKLVVDIDGRAADVATQFGVVRGEIAARVRESEVSANEYVRNCDFAQGLWCWGLTGSGTKTFTAGDAVASAGGSLLALGKDVALSEADGVRVLEFLGGRGTTEVSQRAGDLLGEPSGDVTVSVWARKYGDTREGAVLQVRAGGVTRAWRRASEMGDGWVRVDATFAWTGGPVSVRSVLGHFAVRAVTMQRDARAVAESVLELRADQASLSTRMGAAEAKIATSVQVDGEGNVTSRVVIGGDKVVIRGATSVNGAFTVDEEGFMRATGGGLVRGLTVEGAVNNLVTEIDLSGSVADAVAGGYVSDAGGLSSGIHSDPKAVCLNPWACGGVVVLDDTSGTHGWELFLPTAYCAGSTLVFSPGLDAATTPEEGLRRLRQLIGKRICVYTRTGASAEDWKPWLMGDVLCVSSDGLNLSWADNWRPAGDAVVPGYGGGGYHPLVLSDLFCVWLECCVGVYGGYECIYWKIYEGAETLENCIN